VHRFANEIVYTFTGSGRLRDRDRVHRPLGEVEGKELYISDGRADLRKVTDNRSFNSFPLSPDGQWLAYTSFRTGVPTVYLRNVATGAEKESSGSRVEGPRGLLADGCALRGVSQAGNSDIYRSGCRSAAEKIAEGWGSRSPPPPSPDGADRLRLHARGSPRST